MLKIHGGGKTFVKLHDQNQDGLFCIRKNINGEWLITSEQMREDANGPVCDAVVFKCEPSTLRKLAEWILENVADEKAGHE